MLVELHLPVSESLQRLAKFPWESEHPLIIVTRFDLARVLRGFLDGTLESGDCEEWANAIESREDLGFDAATEETLKDVVFELANPLLTGPLTPVVAAELLGRVRTDS